MRKQTLVKTKHDPSPMIRALLGSAPWANGEPDLVLAANEATLTEMEALRADLLGPAPSATEAALVEAALVGWLHARLADMTAASTANLKLREFHARAAERGSRRFLAALRTLATIRRLLKPQVVQLNVGYQQVNGVALPEPD